MSLFNDDDCRILIISQRTRRDGFGRQPGYVISIEAEDVLAAATGADMAFIEDAPSDARIKARRIAGRQLRRLSHSGQMVPAILPGRTPVETPAKSYDVGIFIGFTSWDLPLLERMPELRERCDRLMAWFPEVWTSDVDSPTARYEPFDLVDHLFAGMVGGSEKLRGITNTPVHYLPMAVDVTRFAPAMWPQPRPIDVLGIGRRNPALHESLLDWSRKTGKLYVYDTIAGATVPDVPAHRTNLGDTYARTNIALTSYAKIDQPEVTQGEREVPGRLWEGLAGGAVMVGQAPRAEIQERAVGRTVVTDLPQSPAEAVEVISEVAGKATDAERMANTSLALRSHDWAHRWRQSFLDMGLPVPPGIDARIDELATMATTVENAL
ncbi:MAG: hypothetical protein AAGD35_11000 [Actinomycetota bacterium]